MGRNYYCDYCDKRVRNDIQIRKKHIQGLQHQTAQSEHYAKFKGKCTSGTEINCYKHQTSTSFIQQILRVYCKQKCGRLHALNFYRTLVSLVPFVASVITHQNNYLHFKIKVMYKNDLYTKV